MSKVRVVIGFETSCELADVTIERVSLIFQDGIATIELEKGKSYLLEWTVEGEEGCVYTLKFIEPSNIGSDITRTLDSAKKDAGSFLIEL